MKPLLSTLFLLTILVFPGVTFAVGDTPGSATGGQLAEDTFEVSINAEEGTVDKGFVPCSGNGCSACDFVVMANTIIKWLISISFLFFALLAVIAGFKLITAGGNPGALRDAKSSFTNAFIGLLIILAAWLLVDTLMRTLTQSTDGTASGFGPWSQIQCGSQTQSGVQEGLYQGDPVYTLAQLNRTFGQASAGEIAAANVAAGNCSPANLQSMGMNPTQANVFSCIAQAESGCDNNAANTRSTARGILQITRGYNTTCHNLNLPACSAAAGVSGNLNCSQAFSGGRVKAGMEDLARKCNTAASNQRCNVAAAICLYQNEGGYGPWLGTNARPHVRQRACVARYAN